MHTYFNCEFTIVLSISNPFHIDNSTQIIGQTSNSLKFECSLSDLGSDLGIVIKDKIVKQVLSSQEKNEAHTLEKILKKSVSMNLINFSAYPIVVNDCCQYVVIMCNRKANEYGSYLLT